MLDPLATGPTAVAGPAITVRLFGSMGERAGWRERRVPLPAARVALTPAQLWCQLGLIDHPACVGEPGAGPLPARIRIAINHGFADPEQVLEAGDEVAFLPPISGG